MKARGRNIPPRGWSAICSFAPRTICRSPAAPRRPIISTCCAGRCTAPFRKPLIVMTPKSLLRHKKCVSLPRRHGARLVVPPRAARPGRSACPAPPPSSWCTDSQIKRVVLCTGKVYFDLMEEREKRGENRIQILRIEQLYPFPENVLAQELNRFPKAELVWCQEEPQEPGRLDLRRAAHRRHRSPSWAARRSRAMSGGRNMPPPPRA